MRIKPFSFVLLSVFTCLLFAAEKSVSTTSVISPLVGTWEIVSVKYGNATTFSDPPADRKSVKFVTPTHFIWIWVNPKTGQVSNSMGGRYKHEGDSYVETVEFAMPRMEVYVGKDQKFTAKLEGDKWIHSGVLSEGQKIEEIWKRVK